ncbi:hypothetical protein PR003_g14359 [Phytophthora rubi]|uniref:Uncharacterized protein n=1 Tax=Phytophthora rubi TaxID=129364 RepID=A0A6A3L3X3_9STRA|nr:hypothetical protein PR002_g14249 [Phytophthora rubi]KAE9332754.1 hypothetical protein PR003_g14359 [Phytophthora rubi]
MIKRRIDRFGNQVEAGSALWRKLRTFSLVAGSWEAPTRTSLFNVSLQGEIDASVDATIRQLRGACDETSRTCSQREKDDTENSLRSGGEATEASDPMTATTAPPDSGAASREQPASPPCEETEVGATQESPIVLEETEDSDEPSQSARAATPAQIEAADNGKRSGTPDAASASEANSAGTVHEDTAGNRPPQRNI